MSRSQITAMKNNSNSLGNSSTNTASLSRAIKNIKNEIRPTPTVSRAPSNPKAMIRTRDVWMPRKVRTFHKGTTTQSLLFGDVSNELGVTDTTSIKVLSLTAWNVTPQGKNSQFLFLETEETMTLSGVRVECTDLGTASHLAGVRVNIPNVLARAYNGSNSTTTILAKISGNAYGTTTTDEQQFVVDWDILWNVSSDQ